MQCAMFIATFYVLIGIDLFNTLNYYYQVSTKEMHQQLEIDNASRPHQPIKLKGQMTQNFNLLIINSTILNKLCIYQFLKLIPFIFVYSTFCGNAGKIQPNQLESIGSPLIHAMSITANSLLTWGFPSLIIINITKFCVYFHFFIFFKF